MSDQYYTKTQIDELATIIGTRIKENASTGMEPAKDISSFMAALDGTSLETTQFLNIPMITPTSVNSPVIDK